MAELRDALQHVVVAVYQPSPTICTTCCHGILKSALLAPQPTLRVSVEDLPGPPTILPTPATSHAPAVSLDRHSTAGSANNNSTEAVVEDRDVEFAPLHPQVFPTRKLAHHAARTLVRRFVSIPGRQSVYACPCEGYDTKRYMQRDHVARRWTIKQIGLCVHGTKSSYLEGMSLYFPLAPTFLYIPAVWDSHSHQSLGHLHPNTSAPSLCAHFLELWQSAQFILGSRCLAQILFTKRIFHGFFCTFLVQCIGPLLQCQPAIVINSREPYIGRVLQCQPATVINSREPYIQHIRSCVRCPFFAAFAVSSNVQIPCSHLI